MATVEEISDWSDFDSIRLGTAQLLLDRKYHFPRDILDKLIAYEQHDAVVALLLKYGYRFQCDPWLDIAHRLDGDVPALLLEYKIRPEVKTLRTWLRVGKLELLRDLHARGVWKYRHALLRFDSHLRQDSVELLLEVVGKQRDQAVERLRKLMHPDDLQKVIDAPTEL